MTLWNIRADSGPRAYLSFNFQGNLPRDQDTGPLLQFQ